LFAGLSQNGKPDKEAAMITTSGVKSVDHWKTNRLQQRRWPPIAPPVPLPAAPGKTGLEAALSRYGPLPPHTAILGIGSNGAPVLLDLADSSPGALLISGSTGNAKTRLLQAILASAIRINRPGQVEVRIIAGQAAQFDHFFPTEHCRQILSADDPAVNEAIIDLLPAVGLPRPGARRAQAVILAVDDLEALTANLDKQAYASLCWLARHGPRLRVWLIATLTTHNLPAHGLRTPLASGWESEPKVDELLLSAFGTCLIEEPEVHAGGNRFWLPMDEQAVPFWICEPEYQEG